MNNVEKLRNYFLGKDPQLKETMADNSLRLIGIEGKHFVLRTELLKRLIDLKKQVDDKDEELQANINEEAATRAEMDTALADNFELLSDEVGELRTDLGDKATQLQGNIDAEARARSESDTALADNFELLSGEISTLRTDFGGQVTQLQGNIDTEESERMLADADLLNQIRNITNNYQLKFATILEENVNLTDGSPAPFDPGLYYSISNTVKVNGSTVVGRGVFFYVESPTQIYTLDMKLLTLSKSIYYNQGLSEWMITDREFLLKSQIETTIDDSSSNNYPAGAKAVYDYGQTLGKQNYSTTEQVIGTWLGKPLYQKVITGTIPSTTADGTSVNEDFFIDSDCDMAFVETAWYVEGSTAPYNKNTIPRDLSTYDDVQGLYVEKRVYIRLLYTNNLRIYNSVYSASGETFYAIVNYTKTTD